MQSEENTSSVFSEVRNTFINPFMVGIDSELIGIGNDKDVTLISPSGDTDIVVLALGVLDKEEKSKVTVMDGRKKNRKIFKLSNLHIGDDISKCVIGLHAFAGNDYNSSIFHRGKTKGLQVMERNQEFMNLFKTLGDTLDVDKVETLLPIVEHYVCRLYSTKFKQVNKARYHLFNNKLTRSKAVVDIATLPPCQSVLKLHLLRAAYVAHSWNISKVTMVPEHCIIKYGWNTDDGIH